MPAPRHHQSGALRPGAVLKTTVAVALIATATISYVAQKNKLLGLSREITKREAQLDQLVRENQWRTIQLEDLLLPQKLAERAQKLQLGLGPVHQTQWVKLPEPGEQPPVPVAGSHLLVGK